MIDEIVIAALLCVTLSVTAVTVAKKKAVNPLPALGL